MAVGLKSSAIDKAFVRRKGQRKGVDSAHFGQVKRIRSRRDWRGFVFVSGWSFVKIWSSTADRRVIRCHGIV